MFNKAKKIRKEILINSYKAGACHIGSSLSCVEILLDIFKKMKKSDRFIFSKASGACTYYILLSDMGYFPKKDIPYYLKNYPLCDKRVPGVLHSVGSLGHGLPVSVGLALADRNRDVYVLMSDGEIQSGTTWECLLFIKQHKLKNLKVYVDNNGIQACDWTNDVLKIPWGFLKQRGFNIIKTTKGKGVDFMENKIEWHYKNLDEAKLKQALCRLK
jgi:transketolase